MPELERDARRVRDYNRKRELVPIVSQESTLALKSPQAGKESVCYVALIHSSQEINENCTFSCIAVLVDSIIHRGLEISDDNNKVYRTPM